MSQFDIMVARMMSRYGGSATLLIPTEGGVYQDGEFTPAATIQKSVRIALDEYPQMSAGDKANFNSLILEGDKRCLMIPINKANPNELPYEVRANKDSLVINGVEWTIQGAKQVNPSGSDCVLWELHLRK